MYTNWFVAKSGSTAMPSTPRSESEVTFSVTNGLGRSEPLGSTT
jgi:hypothetical protein